MTNPLYDTLFGRHADRAATFIVRPDGSRIPYAAFLGRAAQVAHAIRRAGVKPGDRVAVQVEKSAEAVALYAACAQAGAVFLWILVAALMVNFTRGGVGSGIF